MKIFITGINGVLGTVLKDKLRSQDHVVHGCDLTHSADPRIMRADIRERRQLARAMDQQRGCDLVYHFAAEFGRNNGQDYYEQLWSTNCIGTRNVIEECIERKIKMVFASSSEAYGLSEAYATGPLTESLLDTFPPQFHNEYALSKYTNERQIHIAARNSGLDAIILRFFNVYGPPERYSPYRSVACQFAYKLLAELPLTVNREGKRSHLWIGDWANTVSGIASEYALRLSDHNQFPRNPWPGSAGAPHTPVFNIGGREYESVENLYIKIREAVENSTGCESRSKITFIDSEAANTATKQSDNLMAALWLGHSPTTSLADGLKETVLWLRKEYRL